MKTIEQRAQDLLSTMMGQEMDDKLQLIVMAFKDQDKITRHAFVDELNNLEECVTKHCKNL